MSQAFNGRQGPLAAMRRHSMLPAVVEIDPDTEQEDQEEENIRPRGSSMYCPLIGETNTDHSSAEAISGSEDYQGSNTSWSNYSARRSPSISPSEAKVQKLTAL